MLHQSGNGLQLDVGRAFVNGPNFAVPEVLLDWNVTSEASTTHPFNAFASRVEFVSGEVSWVREKATGARHTRQRNKKQEQTTDLAVFSAIWLEYSFAYKKWGE